MNTINVKANSNYIFEIYDLSGRLIIRTDENQRAIDVSGFAAGLYQWRFTDQTNQVTGKIEIVH
jgi:hypothetical protein